MPKKDVRRYVCSECGYTGLYPSGRCPSCGSWGTMAEERPTVVQNRAGGAPRVLTPESIRDIPAPVRTPSGIGELDRVLGGGWVPGGVVLLGGQPGIGKSTLLLQVCGAMTAAGSKVIYVSGEESAGQLGLRAARLGVLHDGLEVCCHTVIDEALQLVSDHALLVVDSVQAMRAQDEDGWPGTPTQVRAVAQRCLDFAKTSGVPTVLVGHITKEGRLAGPMLLEHMVDTVIMFSGEKTSLYRTLRASKNRYGGTDELGIFEMGGEGLVEVSDPSYLYWNRSDSTVSGVAMTVLLEGSRPLVAEIQALAAQSEFAYPRRMGMGVGANKLQLLLAVLESRCGLPAGKSDLYCNVAGGLEVRDPAADLAVAAALASAVSGVPIGPDCCLLAEVGLAGELRPVTALGSRLKEAERLGFRRVIISSREKEAPCGQLELIRLATLGDVLRELGAAAGGAGTSRKNKRDDEAKKSTEERRGI
ncbi:MULTISPECIES: DNA repair protein RadA [Jonquetella]|uniref:DNA repair protein RadA n=1 Tax=Jonquetella anthropi DSM 22815 TaxID=885272 RepID=H0UK07_9BACT|nr:MULTISPECIES: DNA repair protein RadA [Jonquetella]EHM13017.1 DNA repair protein RadA [Jonquetella anthropi DSM 22815]ERL23780.1 DNA repair protein RadA [Jonquetella sp. BV3C21]